MAVQTDTDTSFLDHLAPNIAVQFLDRVAKSPDAEAYRFPAVTAGRR